LVPRARGDQSPCPRTDASAHIILGLDRLTSDEPGALDLNKLFLEPRHIRGGIGRALLAHAVAKARQRGAERLTIPG
jgi:GNAT superfamily N-acetyltransferase